LTGLCVLRLTGWVLGMPTADGRFKGLSVPAEAWERIFGPTDPRTERAAALTQEHGTPRAVAKNPEHTQSPIGTLHRDAMERRAALRASYEEHLDVIGPDSHSPFLHDFRR